MAPATETLDRVIALLQDARDAALDAHEEDPAAASKLIARVNRAVLVALEGTWVPAELLPYCTACAGPLISDDDDLVCPTCARFQDICQRCSGIGELSTWIDHAPVVNGVPSGSEAMIKCPDCNGTGQFSMRTS